MSPAGSPSRVSPRTIRLANGTQPGRAPVDLVTADLLDVLSFDDRSNDRLFRVSDPETDSGDRRRAVVALTAAATSLLHRVYCPIDQAGRRELARYSAAELAVVVDFLRRAERLQLDQAARVRDLRVDKLGP